MAAVTFGVVALLVTLALIGNEVIKGDRPEEQVAQEFLAGLLTGRGADVYDLTTPGYRAVVFATDLDGLSNALATTAPDITFEVLGSERTPGSVPLDSYVGYSGTSAIGRIEGVVVVVELAPGEWFVRDVSYRFPDAEPEAVADLFAFTEHLNQQIAERAESGS